MGKPNEVSNPENSNEERDEGVQDSTGCNALCSACVSGICTAVVFKWVVALLVCLNILAFGVLSLPFFGRSNVGANGRAGPGRNPQAQIQASFKLWRPPSALNANIRELESAVWEEVGIPYTKVAVTSLEPLNATNSTEVLFDVLPDPGNTSISSYGLLGLRETFLTVILGTYNLSFKSEAFGDAYDFQLLKFPGGITVVPKQRVFSLDRSPLFFNFTLNSTITQVVQNLAQLRKQLSIGLRVQPNEDVFVQLTNLQGSTLDPPIIVETFIVPVVGKGLIPPPRLRQLAHEINPTRNLGLNHTLFGKVKQIQLSSYLRYPSSPPTYLVPSPAPSHSRRSSHISPLPSHPYIRPNHAMPPSSGQHVLAPSPYRSAITPISNHHTMSPYYHGGVPSSQPSHVHCDRHHAYYRVQCRQQHVGHAPQSNGDIPSPSPDIVKHSRHHHHNKGDSSPQASTPLPSAFSPRNGLAPNAGHWYNHLPPGPSASPTPQSGFLTPSPHHLTPRSTSPASNAIASSPKSSSFSPEGVPNSPTPQKSRITYAGLPKTVSPAPAISYVSSSSFGPSPIELVAGSLFLVGTVLSVLS